MNIFEFQATGIGSLGHTDPKDAVSFILNLLTEIPFWVQLPQRSFKENMYVQFSEGIPGIVIKEEERKVYVDTRKITEEDLSAVYEGYLAGNIESFGISRDYSEGFFEFIKQIKEKKFAYTYLKGQITGPVSFLLTVTDETKKPLIYHEQIADSILKILTMKAVWQVRRMKGVSQRVLIFIDEPYLVSLGSGFVNLDARSVLDSLNEIIEGIHHNEALVGIHCCGNTDWALLTQTKTDIISFDAYNFSDSLLIYSEAINNFLKKGGVIAWGIVPTDLDVKRVDADRLLKRLVEVIESMVARGIERDLILKQSLITPSCGLGSFPLQQGELVIRTAFEISQNIRERLK